MTSRRPWRAAVCGAVANVVECCIMHPLDSVKTRFQLHTSHVSEGNPGIWITISSMLRRGGFKELYRGSLPAVGMQAPRGMVKFGVNSSVLGQLQQGGARTSHGIMGQAIGATMAGFAAGSAESLFITPFELLKVRLQAADSVYKNSFDAARQVLRLEGVRGLWRGLAATALRNGSWNAAYFGTIHTLRCSVPQQITNVRAHASSYWWVSFWQGTLAGTFGSLLSNPIDVCKTRIQNALVLQGRSAPVGMLSIGKMMVHIHRAEGALALYKGFCAKVLRLGPGGGILLVAFDAADSLCSKIELLY
uniref:Mitochondrial 2-oxodicarboxylate carrier n=1 Tax=Karlodinium veneficum TaxID=407301 RepID=F2WQ62_KARVE|nr:mitochondrial 2-oxodicarboxylate carrier [Karlodinium veneficum]